MHSPNASHFIPSHCLVTNYQVELTAIPEAAKLVSTMELQSHCVPHRQQVYHKKKSAVAQRALERDTMWMLCSVSQKKAAVVQWILSYCGLLGNEEADSLAKFEVARQPQHQHPVSYSETKTKVRHQYKKPWTGQHIPPSNDQMQQISHQKQTTIFRLQMKHCQWQAYLITLACHALSLHMRSRHAD